MSQVSRFGALGRAWRARPSPLRSNDGLLLLESFLVAAVISVLVIRWFLTLADFPRLGSGGLHIAHMLWGGAFMLVAILLLLAYLDRPVQHAAAFIAGLGFGTFIDEIGKFVTTDNDYFFRPAVSLIYVVFVVVFLVAHALVGQRRLTEREALANALDLLEPRLGRPIEGDDRSRIEDLLDQAGGVRDWSMPSPATSTSCQAVLTSSPGGRRSREGLPDAMRRLRPTRCSRVR